MLYREINLKEHYEGLKFDVKLVCMVPQTFDGQEHYVRRSMLILPGGGYQFVSLREADPIALNFMVRGYNTYILYYNVNVRYPNHLKEVMCAMDYLRTHAEELEVDVNQLGVIGFSAGGHLAGSYGYEYNNLKLQQELNLVGHDLKPNYLVLSYPVIISGEKGHMGSFYALLGEDYPDYTEFDVNKHVTEDYPITYMWHCAPDDCVPVESALLMDKALEENGVKHLTKIFPEGWHGLSTGTVLDIPNDDPYIVRTANDCKGWIDECCKFLDKALK